MKLTRSFVLKALRMIALVAVCSALTCHADDYMDISQLMRINKFPEALIRVDSQLLAKPADPQLRFLKGVIQRHLGKQAEAIAIFTKLTEDYPELPEPYNNLAVLYAAQGQYDKARVALEMAIRTNPSYATAHENIGDVYARLASQAYNKALQLDNSNTAVQPKLALIRELFKPNLSSSRPQEAAVVAASTPLLDKSASTATLPSSQPASKPMIKPAPSATVVASAPVKATPVAAPAKEAQAAEAAVMAWAQAWSAKDMAGYFAAYSPDYVPAGQASRATWEQSRSARITGKSNISVTLSDLKLKVNGDMATATFRQAYKANALQVSSRKTLELRLNANQKWLITRETTGN